MPNAALAQGGTAMATPINRKRHRQEAAPQEMYAASEDAFSQAIAAGMCGVDVEIRRPGGSIRIPGVTVLAATPAGESQPITKTTTPGFIIDHRQDHEFWYLVDENQRAIETILRRYAISDAKRGFHLVPMGASGNMLSAISLAKKDRQKLVEHFCSPAQQNLWRQNLQEKYPNHFHLLEGKLPEVGHLQEKFNVTWDLRPFTPLCANGLNFKDINRRDKQQIIDESNRMAQELISQRAGAVYSMVFGSLLEQCEAIAHGALETGTRRFGGIEELVLQLERLKNFSDFATPEMVQHAENTLAALGQIKERSDIVKLNENKGQNQLVSAIKAAMRPLGASIRQMYDSAAVGSGYGARGLE